MVLSESFQIRWKPSQESTYSRFAHSFSLIKETVLRRGSHAFKLFKAAPQSSPVILTPPLLFIPKCRTRHAHPLCLNRDILPLMEHISVILQGRHRPSRDNAAGRQLYCSSGMAGSAEGEALTPILMRLYAAQSPWRRITQLPEKVVPLTPIQKKSSLSI